MAIDHLMTQSVRQPLGRVFSHHWPVSLGLGREGFEVGTWPVLTHSLRCGIWESGWNACVCRLVTTSGPQRTLVLMSEREK